MLSSVYYLTSKEAIDTAKAVVSFVQDGGKSTDVSNIIKNSSGAITLLTAIEGDSKAWNSVKQAAGETVRNDTKVKTVGLVMNDAATELEEGVRVNIQTFAERTGSTVIVEHGLVDENGKVIMGEEKDGVIRINADFADVAHSISVHEFTHRMQRLAPKASKKFKNYVVSKMKNEGTYEGAIAKLREDYQGLSDEKLIDELCAETAERLFRDEAELTDFIKKDRTLAEWVKDAWLKVLDMLGRTDERTHAQLMWKKCVKEATREKNKDTETGEVRYKKAESEKQSVEERIFGVEETAIQRFSNSLDEFQSNKNKLKILLEMSSRTPKIISEIQNISDKLREKISICKTPFVLQCIGADDLNISIASSVINKATGEIDDAHSISIDSLKSLPTELADPIMVFDSESNNNRKLRSLVVLTSITNQKGHEAIVILKLNKEEGFTEINDISSVYSKTDEKGINRMDDFVKKQIENGNLRYINKEKSDRWLRTSRLQLPTVNTIIASNNNILQKEDIVNRYNMQNGENNSTSSQKRPGVSEKLDEYMGDFGVAEEEILREAQNDSVEEVENDTAGGKFIPPGAEPRRDVKVPESVKEGTKVRRFARTSAEAETLSDETAEGVLQNVDEGKFNYRPISDKSAMNNAYASLDTMGIEWVEKKVNGAISSHNLDKNTVAMAEVLMQKYSEEGQQEKVQQLIIDFAAEGTRMGQSIQAISMLKKLDKNYEIAYIDKIIENLREDIVERNNKKFGKKSSTDIEVSEELREKLREAKTEEEREEIREQIYTEIAQQLPVTWTDRWNAWRYMAMLGNARTHVRNVLGNAFFMPMIGTKNIAAKIVEPIAGRLSGNTMERSKTFIVPRRYKDFAKKDALAVKKELAGGGKHNPSDTIRDKQKLFPKGLEWMRVKVGDALEAEDWLFLKKHYRTALSNYLAANKIDLNNIDEKTLDRAR